MHEQEQGTYIDCIYCQVLNPEIKNNNKNCPRCQGQIKYFQPARMMDRETASREFISNMMTAFLQLKEIDQDVLYLNKSDLSEEKLTTALALVEGLVLKLHIYNVDVKESLIQIYKQLNRD